MPESVRNNIEARVLSWVSAPVKAAVVRTDASRPARCSIGSRGSRQSRSRSEGPRVWTFGPLDCDAGPAIPQKHIRRIRKSLSSHGLTAGRRRASRFAFAGGLTTPVYLT